MGFPGAQWGNPASGLGQNRALTRQNTLCLPRTPYDHEQGASHGDFRRGLSFVQAEADMARLSKHQ